MKTRSSSTSDEVTVFRKWLRVDIIVLLRKLNQDNYQGPDFDDLKISEKLSIK
jgi:hypothetical protein